MSVRIIRLGSPRTRGEGLRIGTVRRPPRGVAKKDFAQRDFYDVWFPLLAPSLATMKLGLTGRWKPFVKRYLREMAKADASRALDLLAALSRSANFSVGCYCEDESRCHRSLLRKLLRCRGANIRR
ncbi:MAG TPA: DUF488 family protein [Burkholderiales bacterium]|nr:DUF488 family protein [Burkholderiales bacterium]